MDSILYGIIGCGGVAGLIILLQKFLTGNKSSSVKVKHDVIQEQNIEKIKVNNQKVAEKLNNIKALDKESEDVINEIKKVMNNTVKEVDTISNASIVDVDNIISDDWNNL